MSSFTCVPVLALALLLIPRAAPQEQEPSLLFIDKAGQSTSVSPVGLALADPRERNAWSVRPLGFAQPGPLGHGSQPLMVTLANGDRLAGSLAPSEGETLNLRLQGGIEIPILIDLMVRIELMEGAASAPNSTLMAPAEGDRLYRRTSGELDAIDGTFDSFTAEGLRFESSALGLKTFGWGEVAALMIEDLGGAQDDELQKGLGVILDLHGESRLRGRLIGLEAQGCRLELAGQEHLFGWEMLEELVVDDGSLSFLSDLPALKEEGRGQIFGDEFEVVWNHRANRCVWKGGPLRCGGRVFRRGIGTHAPTRVTWMVPAGSQFLRGLVGIDDTALYNAPAHRGSVIFRVHADGKLAWESKLITGGAQPLRLPSIPLDGVRTLTLEADMAGAYEGDRANWLDMAFVR